MRLRLWISMVATMGVLLHAGFLVRHSLAMADATQAYHAILTDLATLCRAGPGVVRVPVSDLPSLPQPSDLRAVLFARASSEPSPSLVRNRSSCW